MIEEVANRDGFSVLGKIWKNIGKASVVGQLMVVDEQHDGHGGELFGAGGEAEVSCGVDFRARRRFAKAVAALEDDAIVFADEDGEAWLVWRRDGREDCVDLLHAGDVGVRGLPRHRQQTQQDCLNAKECSQRQRLR